jgi:Tol biopolymer transport system component
VLIVMAVVGLLALIAPNTQLFDINPANVRLPTATPLPTPAPAPTDVHGGHIVFTCTRKAVNQICIIAPDGTGYQQLTNGTANSYYPTIGRNAHDVVFAVNQNDIFDLYRLALDVSQGPRETRSRLKRLTDNVGNTFSPSFSPDGRQVAFLNRIGEAPAAIWVMESDGLQPHQVYAGNRAIVALAWSPNAKRLALSMSVGSPYAYEVFLLDLQDPDATPIQVSRGLQDIGGSIAWSPDEGNLLLFAGPAAAREIYSLRLSDAAVTQLTHGGNNASPAYSPDGRYIVFNSIRNGGQADLYIMRADGHSTRQLTDFPEPDWQPQWGP